MEFTSRYNLRKNIKQRRLRGDIFSRLPDDLIISDILSRLMPREAGRCRLISRRWQNLWKQTVSCRLIFNSFWGDNYRFCFSESRKKRQQFASWVNEFLDLPQHKPKIDEFVVRFSLDSSYSCDINKWLKFALTRGVERLELDMLEHDYHNYVFPGIETLSPLPGLGSRLKDICFKHVDIDGEAIESMLSKCHSLERLSIKSSRTLINLKVCGDSLVLKYLEVADCKNAKEIKISVSSLFSLKYVGTTKALRMGYVPSLSEVCIGGEFCRDFLRRSASNLKRVSQLKKLKLDMSCQVIEECVNYPVTYPKFLSLEQLEVKIEMYNGLFLLWLTVLINAAPSLQTFFLQLKHDQRRIMSAIREHRKGNNSPEDYDTIVVGPTPGLTPEVITKIESASKRQHECLKVVVIHGFVGNMSDSNLARHLLQMPYQSLQKLVLVTSRYTVTTCRFLGPRYQKRSQKRAKLVRRCLPPTVQLVIL